MRTDPAANVAFSAFSGIAIPAPIGATEEVENCLMRRFRTEDIREQKVVVTSKLQKSELMRTSRCLLESNEG
jgi:hypothetical protein